MSLLFVLIIIAGVEVFSRDTSASSNLIIWLSNYDKVEVSIGISCLAKDKAGVHMPTQEGALCPGKRFYTVLKTFQSSLLERL